MLPDQIATKRLLLRPFVATDAAALHDYSRDLDWSRFQRIPTEFGSDDAVKSLTDLLQRDRLVRPTWAITRQGSVIGIVSLSFENDHRISVLGYGVHKKMWGQNMAHEAARAVLEAAFSSHAILQRIRAHTDARNVGSIRVLEKLGFTHEGTLRSNQFGKGEFVDEAVFGLLRGEFAPTTGRESTI